MSGLLADLRFALRQLIRRPGFALAAILTLALGIGANTAVFSLLNGYLLKPLPYPHDNRLVQINHVEAKTGNTGSMSVPSYLGIKRDTSAAFSALAAWKRKNLNLRALGKTQRVRGVKATASLFNVLKIRPFLGHAFTKVDQQPGRGHVAVLSYSLWKHAFGGDSNAIGQTLRLGGEAYKIVGVMPKRFAFPAGSAELWIPYIFSQREKSDPGLKPLEIIGRLAPGVTIALADQRLQTTLEHATRSSMQMRKDTQQYELHWVARSYRQVLVGDRTPMLFLLQGAVFLVLLITCVNVANLLLARILGRTREFAIRSALGASRVTLARQLLIESLCIAIPGGMIGLALGWWSLAFIRRLGLGVNDNLLSINPDWRVVGIALLVTGLTAILVSLLPISQLTRVDPQTLLQDGGQNVAGGRRAKVTRNALVVIEISLSLALIAGAGLLLHSFVKLQAVDPGFNPHHVLTATITASPQAHSNKKTLANIYQDLMHRAEALPGVTAAGLAFQLPFQYHASGPYDVLGRAISPEPEAWDNMVAGQYFKALDMPALRGRTFDAHDSESSEPVVVIDQLLARRRFPHQNAVGRFLLLGGQLKVRVIGVVPTVKSESLAMPDTQGTIYLPVSKALAFFPVQTLRLVIKSSLPPYALIGPLKQLLAKNAPGVSISNFKSLSEIMADSVQKHQATMTLVLVFGAIALTLAVVGIYGVLSYSVRQRVSECGIRLALGATPRDLLWLIINDGLRLLIIGLVIGLGLAMAFGVALSAQLFKVAPFDPITLVGATIVLSAVGLLACYFPARRASKLDPATAIMEQ